MKDKRYTLEREWCGYAKQQVVVRFCARWIGCRPTRAEAVALMHKHAHERLGLAIKPH